MDVRVCVRTFSLWTLDISVSISLSLCWNVFFLFLMNVWRDFPFFFFPRENTTTHGRDRLAVFTAMAAVPVASVCSVTLAGVGAISLTNERPRWPNNKPLALCAFYGECRPFSVRTRTYMASAFIIHRGKQVVTYSSSEHGDESESGESMRVERDNTTQQREDEERRICLLLMLPLE